MVLITKSWAAAASLREAIHALQTNPETAEHFAKTIAVIGAAQKQLKDDKASALQRQLKPQYGVLGGHDGDTSMSG